MAMNKAEKAAFETLRIQGALRHIEYPVKPLDTEATLKGIGTYKLVSAYTYNSHLGGWSGSSISYGCFTAVSHSRTEPTKTCSQGRGGPWFLTKLDALKALRMAVADKCATILAGIDAQIESESAA